jgi:membrane associated rhomboid family serine protease
LESDIQKHNPFWQSLLFTFSLISVLWIVKIYELVTHNSLVAYGILPKHIIGLRGIIFSPFIHGDLGHLFSNTVPCFILMIVLFNTYDRVALYVILAIHIWSGLLVWLFAPYGGSHIGISGIIYGIAGFLIGSGIFRKDRRSFSIALVVTLLYGSMIGGFIPQEGVSWQGHLYGALVGLIIAFVLRNRKLDDYDHRFITSDEPEKHFFE